MKLYESRCEFTLFLLVAGYLYLAEGTDRVNEFRRCYNTSVEMHCFDLQYDNSTNRWLTASFEDARQRCNNLRSTLIIIEDDDTNNVVQNYLSDTSNPLRFQYVWTDAYRINDYNNSYTWHWLNSKLPNIPASVLSTRDNTSWYVAALEFDNRQSQFHLTDQQPHFLNSYVCEYAESNCSSASSSDVRIMNGRCYRAKQESVSWYEARNRCLQGGGDLASFANVTSINFTSWLGSDVRYWIGLRFTWYIWKTSGDDMKFSKWIANWGDWTPLCLTGCSNCDPSLSWMPNDCTIANNIYVVCHSVSSLQATTLTTASATTLPDTTSVSLQTVTTPSNKTRPNSFKSDNSAESSNIALGVGVGVGVGVPVIVAIVVIVICVIRRHQSKTPATSKTTRQGQREEASPTEVHTDISEVSEINHYATIRSLSPHSSSALVKDPTSEAQYAILDFEEKARRKNDNGQAPLSFL